jgi:hypothetical protein
MTSYVVQETASIQPSGIVVGLGDLRQLATLLFDIVARAPCNAGSGQAAPDVEVVAKGGVRFSGATLDLFDDDGPLANRALVEIAITYHDWKSHTSVAMKLEETTKVYSWSQSNKLSISGSDATWVHGSFKQMTDALERIPPQVKWPWWKRIAIIALVAIVITLPGFFLKLIIVRQDQLVSFGRLHGHRVEYLNASTSAEIFGLIVFLLFEVTGIISGGIISEKIVALYPSVELRIGPSHLNPRLRRRKQMQFLITAVLIPLIVSVAAGAVYFFG